MGSRPLRFAALATLVGITVAPVIAEDESLPPVQTFEPGAGEWQSQTDATLRYSQKITPKTTTNLLSIRCDFIGLRMSVTGLEPLQQFPQPKILITFDDKEYSSRPSASYVEGFEFDMLRPETRAKLESKTTVPPDFMRSGSPPFAIMNFQVMASAKDLPAMLAADAITVKFAGQERVFPPIPADTADKMIEHCGANERERMQNLSRLRNERYARMLESTQASTEAK
ncbi:hypothetical protein [Erythrobacter sp. THAF29]|uniref:hypothetical protein n=1 Tax=Erythrobacter sp. THAF29 TaxID=2587851 RepID=UPI0012A8109A|nr:hypothetical protein [Erythrobacter sp. THAF29]QFT78435.1 hypothetical protein FIU90_12865 [Erythrobacter sp. THAF29]